MTEDALAVEAGRRFEMPEGAYRPGKVPADRLSARSLTAAARRIELSTREGIALVQTPGQWQRAVWSLVDEVPELKFADRFVGNALSRTRMYVGLVIDPREPPVDLIDAVDDPEIRRQFPGLTDQLVADATAELDRVTGGADGQAEMMRGFGEKLAAVGDSYLIGRGATPDDMTLDEEVWEVVSPTNLIRGPDGRSVRLRESPDDRGRDLPPDTVMYRIWRRHPNWPRWADSNMRSVISDAEELLIYGRQFRAVGKSRNSAGILLLPSELDPPGPGPRADAGPVAPGGAPTPDATAVQQTDKWSEFELGLVRSLVTPTEDDGTAASVVPHIIKGRAEFLEKVRHLPLDRMIDKEAVGRMEFLIRRMAHGLDLPVEVLTGVGNVNHWTGWLIEDSTYKAHIEPTAGIPAVGLAAVHLRPALAQQNHSLDTLRRITIGLDPSQLVVRPNRSQDAKDAYAVGAISRAAYLGYLGFPDSDAPEDDELMRRYVLERGIGGQDITAQLLNMLGILLGLEGGNSRAPLTLPSLLPTTPAEGPAPAGEPTGDDGGGGGDPTEGGDPLPETDQGDAVRSAVTAASVPMVDLGETLGSIESRLRDRLIVAASGALADALRTAGTRIRGAAQGDPDLRREVNGLPAEQVGIRLGTERAPVVDTDQLLAGAFDDLEGQWDTWVGQAEDEAAATIAAAAGTAVVRPPDQGQRGAGWTALRLGLLALAGARIFKVADQEPGEYDAASTVPAGIVRDALAVAGGAQASVQPVGTAAQAGPPGLLTGPRWRLVLQSVDVIADGWTWRTGFTSHPFPPHQALSGRPFASWDDPVLSNFGTWPRTGHFYPGDHRGCTCDAIPVLVRTNPPPTQE